jgi:DNA-binding NtrC family response regulator
MSDTFRWQALFQKSRDSIFVLNSRRQLIFANEAWESLTGRAFDELRGFTCTRRKTGEDHADIAGTLTPPPEVLDGKSARIQRPPPSRKTGPPWWEIDFLPMMGNDGLIAILGRISADRSHSPISTHLTEPQVELRGVVADRHRLESLDGRFPSLGTALTQARLAAESRNPILILGEGGVGKQWLARAIHGASRMRHRPFLVLDAAALPPAAITGVLFGPLGLYRSDGAGTIYIHDPAHLPLDVQDELAQRLASTSENDARVIVGSESELTASAAILLPAFASALSILVIRLPSLRDRAAELPAITAMILERLSDNPIAFSPEAAECLAEYSWPDNIDELLAALQTAIAKSGDARIDVAQLPLAVRQARPAAELQPPVEPPFPALDKALEDEERRLIRLALEKSKGNRARAAKLLSIWRPRLSRRIQALGIEEP